MTVAAHPVSQRRSLSPPPAPEQEGDVLTSSAEPVHALHSCWSLAFARSDKPVIALPIDTTLGPPLHSRRPRSVPDPQIPIGRAR
jgi:hypothetical protein